MAYPWRCLLNGAAVGAGATQHDSSLGLTASASVSAATTVAPHNRGGWLVVAALSAATAAYHSLCRANTDDYWWEQREDREGRRRSDNLKTLAVERDGGARALEDADKRCVFE